MTDPLDTDLLHIFRDEVSEYLETLNTMLMQIETSSADAEALRELNRVAHSMKGASRAVGLKVVETIAHYMEEVFDAAQKKKLELAKALATRPSLLFLDEVMGGLSPDEVRDLMDVLRKVQETGVTLVMIQDVLQAITELTQTLLVLHHGALLAHGATVDVIHDPEVVDAYLGEVEPDAVH